MSEKWTHIPNKYAVVKDWLKSTRNKQSIFPIMRNVHLDHREIYSSDSLEEFGMPRDFMINHYTDPIADTAVVYGTIFTDVAIRYGFPADVIILEIARSNRLELPSEVNSALNAMKVN